MKGRKQGFENFIQRPCVRRTKIWREKLSLTKMLQCMYAQYSIYSLLYIASTQVFIIFLLHHCHFYSFLFTVRKQTIFIISFSQLSFLILTVYTEGLDSFSHSFQMPRGNTTNCKLSQKILEDFPCHCQKMWQNLQV